jgi:hypothetical protein
MFDLVMNTNEIQIDIVNTSTRMHVLDPDVQNFQFLTKIPYYKLNSLNTSSIQNYFVFGLCPSSGILDTRRHNVSETGSVSVLK